MSDIFSENVPKEVFEALDVDNLKDVNTILGNLRISQVYLFFEIIGYKLTLTAKFPNSKEIEIPNPKE